MLNIKSLRCQVSVTVGRKTATVGFPPWESLQEGGLLGNMVEVESQREGICSQWAIKR